MRSDTIAELRTYCFQLIRFVELHLAISHIDLVLLLGHRRRDHRYKKLDFHFYPFLFLDYRGVRVAVRVLVVMGEFATPIQRTLAHSHSRTHISPFRGALRRLFAAMQKHIRATVRRNARFTFVRLFAAM